MDEKMPLPLPFNLKYTVKMRLKKPLCKNRKHLVSSTSFIQTHKSIILELRKSEWLNLKKK